MFLAMRLSQLQAIISGEETRANGRSAAGAAEPAAVPEIVQQPIDPTNNEIPASLVETAFADIEKALETSGLVMVETSSDKAKSWQPDSEPTEVKPIQRRKRQVKAAVLTSHC